MKKNWILIGLLGLFLLSSSLAQAALTGASGVAVLIAPPPSIALNAVQSNTQIVAFDEQQDVVLASDLAVNITASGTYDSANPLTPGTIADGTTVSSHYVSFDPALVDVSIGGGTLTFDKQIIGVIVEDNEIDSSDSILGNPGTTYPTGLTFHGLEIAPSEVDSITVGCNTLTVNNLYVWNLVDQFRVITGTQSCAPTGGLEGCSPNFWKQAKSDAFWANYQPDQKFNRVFNVKGTSRTMTLRQALKKGSGDELAFKRQAVAALLNASSSVVNYAYTEAQVLAIVRNAYGTRDFKNARIDLAQQNKLGCLLETLQ